MVDTSSYQNKSEIIEERIRLFKQKAKESESLEMHGYAIILEGLYDLVRERAPEVLPQLEEVVKWTDAFTYDIQKLAAIRDYIRDYILPTEQENIRKQKTQKLKEGLEKLLDQNVENYLYDSYKSIRSGELIPLDFDFYLERVRFHTYLTGERLDWKTKIRYAQEEAAYDYLRSHIKCLLSNPEGYMQHLKSGDLEAFVRKSCKPTPR
jgi:predicted house-cleaning noncanonical NTP pyrophosphatase (MazG superfamily)